MSEAVPTERAVDDDTPDPEATAPDRHGRARWISVLTPLRPLGPLALRLQFALTRAFPQLIGIDALKSVYFTRWSLLESIPWNGAPQVVEDLPHPLLVWESTFTGVMEPYIEEFVYAVGPQIDRTWKTSYGFPGVRSITALRDYILGLAQPGSYSYSAYPRASVRMVLAALSIAKEHHFLTEVAATGSPAEFAIAYHGFLRRRAGDL